MLSRLDLKKKLSFLKSSNGLRGIIANTGWLFADRILRMGVGLFVGVWVARYLGVEQFGVFNYATAFVALFSTLSTLGLDAIVVRSIVREPEKRAEILGTAFWLKLFGGVAALVLAVSSIILVRHDDQLTISLVAILSSVGIFQAFDTIDLWFQSQVQSKYTVIAKNTAFVITALVKVTLISIHAPLIAFAWTALGEVGLGAIGLIISYRVRGYSPWLWPWSSPLAKTLLKESWPLILAGVTIMIYMRIDQIMLGQMIGDKAVGLYSAATRISEVWYFIPMAIASSVSPAIYAAKEVSEALYYQRIEQFLRLLSWLSIVVAVPMSFLSGTIITVLFGKSYEASASILAIHIWASLFVFMGVGTSCWFIAEGLTQFALRITIIGAVTNVVLNIFLIPAYGGVGAAIATVIAQAFASFLSNATHPKTRKIFNLQVKCLLPFRL
ncbi:MAG: flippase [Aphanizomenon flos-aquae KM1D3_PB]|uniref:flippase n=1 Tax=Aphanizomenon flos-aquae TaxID=1176 RepID=UPI0005431A04|nr:flippase [Aphanizomenon flos-aquae]KHG41635.1 flippase [Aphanizomenon flos-aquae 2012/KM1/D3]KHG43004.1 flippase [Aphanizomenon flos-aquae 2012/KM1/D3]QSV71518.1 MAG: flippase [Aphanizomenon flos-aquae KM1D3_PB]